MKKNVWFILLLTLFSGAIVNAQNNPVSLSIEKKEGAGFAMKEVEKGMYEVTTATPGNAVVQFAPLQNRLPDDITVLSFDYFCATGLEFLVVCVNNDRSRIEENMIRMPVAEGWTTFSVDVSDKLKQMQNAGDYLNLLIVPNTARATVMRIKNPLLRTYTEKELAQANAKIERENREKRLEQDISSYLKKKHACQVTDVQVTGKEVTVSGDLKGQTGDVFLCEVPMYGELTEKDFLTTRKVEQPASFKMTFDRYAAVDGLKYDRLYSRWVLAQRAQDGYVICSHGRYAEDVEALYDLPHEVVRSKKGIGGFGKNGFEQDIDDLQATSVTVNINLSFMRLTPSNNTIPFDYNGKTYYADRRTIEQYDRNLQFTASKDVIVSAIVLIPPERAFGDKTAGKLFEHPDFDAAGIYAMPNMTTLESLNLYAAAMDFLASRYSRPDKQYGRIHHWIAHNEVDAGWVWTNAGIKTPLRFMDIYLKSMRLLYYTARKYNSHSETLITLTHYWQDRHNEYCYPSALLLDILLDYTAAEGDFKWGVAHHPYPQSLFEPKSWLDTDATFDYNTPLITFKNLEVLDAWIKQPRVLYKGKEKRTLYLSEQNPNSKDYSEEALQEQAAGMAYALKKMDACTGIDAYQMHGWFDQRGEGGLRIGIRRFPDDETDPSGRKPAWFVFQAFGTDREEEVFAFAKKIIGIENWEQIIHKTPIPMSSARAGDDDIDYVMTVARCNPAPVVDKRHPGSADNDQGYENGHVIKINGVYHLLITELFDDKPYPETLGSVPGRVGYWRSTNGDDWERVCTIVQGNGIPGDPKNNTWSASWYWNEAENRWNIFWRGNAVFRYRSATEGPEGFAGPYTEATKVYPPLAGTRQYWDNGWLDSFGNIYIAEDGKFYTFVGIGDLDDANDMQWVNGLAWADDIDGPWTRLDLDTHPVFVYSENPFVNIYENTKGEKVYFCVYDDLSNQHSLGYGYSTDGIHWTGKTFDLTGYTDWSANNHFVASVRTPCCLIKEDDGTFSIFFTARSYEEYFYIGRVNVRIDEVKKPSDKQVVFPGDMRKWKAVNGNFEVQYGREYSQLARDDNYYSEYTAATYTDVTVEASLRYIDQIWDYDVAKAGIHVRKKNIEDKPEASGYHVYLTANEKVQLYAGDKLLAEVNVDKRPGIFRKVRLSVKANRITVFYDGASEPCIDVFDNTFSNAGYVGIDVCKSHWHYDRIEIIP